LNKGPATLNPLKWHNFRFALGHHLFQHPLSPYDEKIAQDVAKLLPRMKEQASTATTTIHSLFMAAFTPEGRPSPTLYGIFVADLVHELRAKFPYAIIYLGRHPPNPHTLGSTKHIWIGGLPYVDELALM